MCRTRPFRGATESEESQQWSKVNPRFFSLPANQIPALAIESYVFDEDSYLQESPTIFSDLTFKWPCSVSSFFAPVSAAALLASSFKLCNFACDTTPCAATVCPT